MKTLPLPEDLWAYLRAHAAAPAVVSSAGATTWQGLLDEAAELAAHLQAEGIGAGDLCALHAAPHVVVPHLFALWMLGAVAVPLHLRIPIERAVETARRIGCRFFLPQGKARQKPMNAPTFPPFNLDRPATVLFTSGSSGEAKACVHSFRNHLCAAVGAVAHTDLCKGDRWLLSLPLYHIGGLAVLFRVMTAGAARRFQQDSLEETLQSRNVTHLSLVPTQLYRLLQNPAVVPRLRRLKTILLGGAAVPEPLIRRAFAERLPIMVGYGSTETASMHTATRRGDTLEHLLTSGRPLPMRELKISGDGEICVRSDALFIGYLGENGLERPTADGWFATGDLGFVDDDGYLHVTGRRDNRFIAGGENIHPEEVERCLLELADVAEALVVPVADEEFGSLPVAFIRTASGRPARQLDLSPLRSRLPGYKIPRRLFDWPAANEGTLKTSRKRLQELAQRLWDQLSET